MSLHIIILAAGQGKRMHSTKPKVLHEIGGKPMLSRIVDTALHLTPEKIHVIVGHGGEQIMQTLSSLPVHWITQSEQLGTGHAVLQALPYIPDSSQVLVLYGDVPLIQLDTLKKLINHCNASTATKRPLGLLLASLDNPKGLGRIIRNEEGRVQTIVEEKDATDAQRNIHEIYTGICYAQANCLHRWLPSLNCNNAQEEYYLTEIIEKAYAEQWPIESLQVDDPTEAEGVNNMLQLQQLERQLQKQIATELMLAGVTLADASRIDVRGELHCGKDVFIDINTVFSGQVILGDHCTIGPNCILSEVTLGAGSEILPNSLLEHCHIGENCQIGPFARLRAGTELAADCKIGNFVETKKAVFGANTKASHLSYLGDVTLGKNVNIGAGTITCNYDGVNKHQTIIEDGVFVGSDTQLIAPVTVGADATIGAGSTIRKNVPPGELTLTEAKQKTILGWKRPQKKEKI